MTVIGKVCKCICQVLNSLWLTLIIVRMLRQGSRRLLSLCTQLLRPTEGETRLTNLLKTRYTQASLVQVEDISSELKFNWRNLRIQMAAAPCTV